MSIPHTGRLRAIVKGVECKFDGDTWSAPDAALAADLNHAMDFTVKHHASIDEIARHVFEWLRIEADARIVSVQHDRWRTELPPGAID